MTRWSPITESGGPSAMTLPWAITMTQSEMSRTMSMSCSTNSTVRPSSRSDFTWPEQRLLEGRVHAGHRLVEHHQLGVGHQRAGHLEQLALAAGQRAGEVLALLDQQEALEQVVGALGVGRLLAAPERREHRLAAGSRRCWPVAPTRMFSMHGQPGEHLGQLEGAHHAAAGHPVGRDALEALAVERPVALVGPVEAGQQVEERGLAGTVGADQAGDHAALDLDVLDVDGREAAERAHDAVGDHDRVGLLGAGLVRDVARAPRGRPRRRRRSARRRARRCRWLAMSAGIEGQLPSVSEDPLWSEDHQQHQREAQEDEPHQAGLVAVHDRSPGSAGRRPRWPGRRTGRGS